MGIARVMPSFFNKARKYVDGCSANQLLVASEVSNLAYCQNFGYESPLFINKRSVIRGVFVAQTVSLRTQRHNLNED